MKYPFRVAKGIDMEKPSTSKSEDRPAPDRLTYVVGDVHGCANQLEELLDEIDADLGQRKGRNPDLVFVGNVIGRGDNSAQVLHRMLDLERSFPQNVICLMGSQERMLLDFLADPERRGARWLREGGLTTLRSFGLTLSLSPDDLTAQQFGKIAETLESRMGADTLEWISTRPLQWVSGNLAAVHAAADPMRPMSDQRSRVLLWGHPEFGVAPRQDGLWIVHGHEAVERPTIDQARIAVNTAVWRTGVLCAAVVEPGAPVSFLSSR